MLISNINILTDFVSAHYSSIKAKTVFLFRSFEGRLLEYYDTVPRIITILPMIMTCVRHDFA